MHNHWLRGVQMEVGASSVMTNGTHKTQIAVSLMKNPIPEEVADPSQHWAPRARPKIKGNAIGLKPHHSLGLN